MGGKHRRDSSVVPSVKKRETTGEVLLRSVDINPDAPAPTPAPRSRQKTQAADQGLALYCPTSLITASPWSDTFSLTGARANARDRLLPWNRQPETRSLWEMPVAVEMRRTPAFLSDPGEFTRTNSARPQIQRATFILIHLSTRSRTRSAQASPAGSSVSSSTLPVSASVAAAHAGGSEANSVSRRHVRSFRRSFCSNLVFYRHHRHRRRNGPG